MGELTAEHVPHWSSGARVGPLGLPVEGITGIETETAVQNRRGRRPSSSRSAIEDAAGELFLENSYPGTTIGQIAERAGVSRASFFNYFEAKSDLLWGDLDLLIDEIAERLARQAEDARRSAPAKVPDAMPSLCAVLVDAASGISAGRIPLAVTQWDVMGVRDELLGSGLARFDRLATLIRRYLAGRCSDADAVLLSAAALAITGAATAGAAEWAAAGVGRGDLSAFVSAATTPVCDGFTTRFC